jgi:hypothetical protein
MGSAETTCAKKKVVVRLICVFDEPISAAGNLVQIDERRALRETVVTLCDGETVNLSQNKHPDLLGYCREENQSASLTQAAFSCGSRFGTQKVQYAKA